MDILTLEVPNIVGQGELRDKEHSSNHGFLLFWNAEVKVDGMTLPFS